jgi:hypothetical protein
MMFRLLALGLLAGLLGCQKPDEIQTYKVPKTSDSPKPGSAKEPALPDAPATGEYRILGAMFPADQPEWFFRVVGPADKLTPHKDKFVKMLASVRFPNGLQNAPLFDAPEGWKLGGGRPGQTLNGITIAGPAETILIDGDKTLEITVTSAMGEPFANVRRWAVDLLGNANFTRADMPNVTKPVEAQKIQGLFADVTGPKNPAARRMMGGR